VLTRRRPRVVSAGERFVRTLQELLLPLRDRGLRHLETTRRFDLGHLASEHAEDHLQLLLRTLERLAAHFNLQGRRITSTCPSNPDPQHNAYIYADGNAPLEQVNLSSGTVTYLVADLLGSVRGIVSSSGSLTASTAYDAWGNAETIGGLSTYTPFGYAGGYTDATGLSYLIGRYYDPQTGQFIGVDPIVDQTQAAYSYANGDPVSASDPSGLCSSTSGGQNGVRQPAGVILGVRGFQLPLRNGFYSPSAGPSAPKMGKPLVLKTGKPFAQETEDEPCLNEDDLVEIEVPGFDSKGDPVTIHIIFDIRHGVECYRWPPGAIETGPPSDKSHQKPGGTKSNSNPWLRW
jgi:RHS repeat-associated protein